MLVPVAVGRDGTEAFPMLRAQLAIGEFIERTDVGEVCTGRFDLEQGAIDAAVTFGLSGGGGKGKDCKKQGGSSDGLEAHRFVVR